MRLKEKAAIITGAGSGIGEATARLFAAEGARVAVIDFDEAGGRRVAESIGGPAFFVHADVSHPSDMEKMAKTVVEQFGRIDILFNNAGVSCVGTVHDTSEAEWDRVFTINAKGVYLACKYVVPIMLEQGGGASSTWPPQQPWSAYSSAPPIQPQKARFTRSHGQCKQTTAASVFA